MKDFYELQNELISFYNFSADVSFYVSCVIYGVIASFCVFGFVYLFICLINHIFFKNHYLFILRPIAISRNLDINADYDKQVAEDFRFLSVRQLFLEQCFTVRVGQFTKIMFNSVKKKYSKRGYVICKVLKFNSNFDYKQFVFGDGHFLDYTVVFSEFDKLPNGIYK